jgi:hypothetical protein
MPNLSGMLGDFEESIERGVKQQLKSTGQAVTSQLNPMQSAQSQPASADAGTNEQAGVGGAQSPSQSDPATQEFVKNMYAPSNHQQPHGMSDPKQQPSQFVQQQIQNGKTPEEAAKLEQLRKKLHDETYYIPLTQRKPHEAEQKEEEQVKEQEKMAKLEELEEKKKKDQPIALKMATQTAETFRGASG